MLAASSAECPRCGIAVPHENTTLHQLRCPGRALQNNAIVSVAEANHSDEVASSNVRADVEQHVPFSSLVPIHAESTDLENPPPPSMEEPPSGEQSWACPTCTFQNGEHRNSCEMCLESRPGFEPIPLNMQGDAAGGERAMMTSRARCLGANLFCSAMWGAMSGLLVCEIMGFTAYNLVMGSCIGSLLGATCASWSAIRAHRSQSLLWQGGSRTRPLLSHEEEEQILRELASPRWGRRQAGMSPQQLEVQRQFVLRFLREQQDDPQETQQQPAPRNLIAALPTHIVTAAEVAAAPEEHKVCTICIENFQEGDEVRTLPCFHRFHKNCVSRWLRQNGICPVCKHQIDGIDSSVTV